MIDVKDIESKLKTKIFGKKIFAFEDIDSTNNCAKALAECNSPEGTLIISESQSLGRGSQGRAWYSEKAKNLLFSIILKPKIELFRIQLLTFCVSNSILETIGNLYKINVQAKWPNDLLFNNRKFCGILLESSVKENLEFVVAGIGININQKNFIDVLSTATSLSLILNRDVNREDVLVSILEKFEIDYFNFLEDYSGTIKKWEKHNILHGKNVTVNHHGELFKGVVIGIDEVGALILKTSDNRRLRFLSGDASIDIPGTFTHKHSY